MLVMFSDPPRQIERLTDELKNADPNEPLIVGLHHPRYSVDSHHGGSSRMAEVLDKALTAVFERLPLTTIPLESPAAMLAPPRPSSSRLASIS
jgi:hypothetical protein